MKLRAYNIIPGLVITGLDDQPLVITAVTRDENAELVTITFRDGSTADLDYCFTVTVIGASVNELDDDDDDYGTD